MTGEWPRFRRGSLIGFDPGLRLLLVMMLLKVLFWLALAFDACVIGLIFVLGLAAAGPSHTNPLEVVLKLLIVPAAVLAGLAFWFVRVPSTGSRLIVLLVAASPFITVAFSIGATGLAKLLHPEEAKQEMSFRPVPLTELQNAILDNDLPGVKRLAAAANLKGRRDVSGLFHTALSRVAKSPEHFAVLKALLEAGADPNQTDGTPPLEHALALKVPKEALLLLLQAGADANKRNPLGDPSFFAALNPATDVEMLRVILDHGGDANSKSFRGETALARAQELNNKQAAKLLVEYGAK